MDINEEVEKIKQELLDLILDHLKKNKIETVKAQQQARDFLNSMPIADQKDLLSKLKTLGAKYTEAQSVYLHELEKSEAEKRDQALNLMRDYIHRGDIDNATLVAKSLTSPTSNL